MLELAVEITVGILVSASIIWVWFTIFYGNRVFELYQRFGWLQQDIREILIEMQKEDK